MSPDKDILEDRLLHIRQKVGQIRSLASNVELEEFKVNFEKHYAVIHLLQICIEACSDIASHICSYDNLGIPNSYTEAFEILESHKVISHAVGTELKDAARFRNRIVHLYQLLDLEVILEIAKTKPDIFLKFAAEILDYTARTN
ncbi:MAG TPA: DUF86 domain-containing protein [Oligoflexia bacterium]|nr:DUF86 domain-containing protein [Oligoflexia bacterium]HMP49806.1 DUF86 domain-containing protein [Oligoflexia bacterium]